MAVVELADAALVAEIFRRAEAAAVRADIAFRPDEGRILPQGPHHLLHQLRGREGAQQHDIDAGIARGEHHVAVGVGDDGDHRRLGQRRTVRAAQLPDKGLAVDRMGIPIEQDDVRLQRRLAGKARPGVVGIAEHADGVWKWNERRMPERIPIIGSIPSIARMPIRSRSSGRRTRKCGLLGRALTPSA